MLSNLLSSNILAVKLSPLLQLWGNGLSLLVLLWLVETPETLWQPKYFLKFYFIRRNISHMEVFQYSDLCATNQQTFIVYSNPGHHICSHIPLLVRVLLSKYSF